MYPYPWTLADGATGTVDDATNGLYGTKKVNYQFTDDTFYLEGTRLNNEDYELTNIEWTPTVNDATFNPNSYVKLPGCGCFSYAPEMKQSTCHYVSGY